MIRFGPGLERKQAVLGRIVDIGAELFVMISTVIRAQAIVKENPSNRSPYTLADLFCRQSRVRIQYSFDQLFSNNDNTTYEVAQQTMKGTFDWVEEGLVKEGWIPDTKKDPVTPTTPTDSI